MSRNQTLRSVQALTAFFRLVFDYEKYEMKPVFPYFKDIFLITVRSLPVVIPESDRRRRIPEQEDILR